MNITMKQIREIESLYKNNYKKENSNIEETFGELWNLDRVIQAELLHAWENQAALQPMILAEIYTILEMIKLNHGENAEYQILDKQHYGDIVKIIHNQSPEYVKHIATKSRYIFSVEDHIYFHLGSPDLHDLSIWDGNKLWRYEIKGMRSRLHSFDLVDLYDDNGKLYPAKNIQKEYEWVIDVFNKNDNIIDHMGTNFSIDKHLDYSKLDQYFQTNVHKFIFITETGIKVLSSNETYKHLSFEGSELRIAGRNSRSVFTDKLLSRYIGDGEIITMKESELMPTKARGSDHISRYKINNIFYIKEEHIIPLGNGEMIFKRSNIRQLVPSISIHLALK